MSKELKDLIKAQINYYLGIGVKVGFGIATWFAVSWMDEIKAEIKSNGKDLRQINDRIIRLEDKTTFHDEGLHRLEQLLNLK
jgi:hypothetical protein